MSRQAPTAAKVMLRAGLFELEFAELEREAEAKDEDGGNR